MKIAIAVLVICCASFGVAQAWRLTTPKELQREIKRQYKVMAKLGFCCDPPCTVGMFFMGEDIEYSNNPCAITNGKEFENLIEIKIKSAHRTCRITLTQEFERFGKDNQLNEDDVIEACRRGEISDRWEHP